MTRNTALVLLAALVMTAPGCATVVNGTHQTISITSDPSRAAVTIDGIDQGETPIVVELKRNETHTVMLRMPGFELYDALITSRGTPHIWGNLLLVSPSGFVIDLVSGASNELLPGHVHAVLTPQDETTP